MSQTLTERALVLEHALYKRGIDPVCPLGLTGTADRFHAERLALADAREAAALDDGLNYFAAMGAMHGAELKKAA